MLQEIIAKCKLDLNDNEARNIRTQQIFHWAVGYILFYVKCNKRSFFSKPVGPYFSLRLYARERP